MPSSEFSRRDFLFFVKDASVSLYKKNLVRRAALPFVASSGVDWGMRGFRAWILERRNEEYLRRAQDFFPGSTLLRNKVNLPYMGVHGPIPWYDALLSAMPIHRATKEVFDPVARDPHSLSGAGELLQLLFESTHHALLTEKENYFPQGRYSEDLDAMFGFPGYRDELLLNFATGAASLLNPYTVRFSEKMGYEGNKYTSAWDKKNGFMRTFEGAGILKAANQDTSVEYDGLDRLVHMTHHMALVVILGLSKRYSLPYYLQTPPWFGGIPDYGQMINADTALKHASYWSGIIYEGIQTFREGNLRRIRNGLPVQDGAFDREVLYDLKANFLGSLLGVKLLHIKEYSSLRTVFNSLNSSRLAGPMNEPEIPREVALTLLQ